MLTILPLFYLIPMPFRQNLLAKSPWATQCFHLEVSVSLLSDSNYISGINYFHVGLENSLGVMNVSKVLSNYTKPQSLLA